MKSFIGIVLPHLLNESMMKTSRNAMTYRRFFSELHIPKIDGSAVGISDEFLIILFAYEVFHQVRFER